MAQSVKHLPSPQVVLILRPKTSLKMRINKPISLMNMDANILNKLPANQIQQYIRDIGLLILIFSEVFGLKIKTT